MTFFLERYNNILYRSIYNIIICRPPTYYIYYHILSYMGEILMTSGPLFMQSDLKLNVLLSFVVWYTYLSFLLLHRLSASVSLCAPFPITITPDSIELSFPMSNRLTWMNLTAPEIFYMKLTLMFPYLMVL